MANLGRGITFGSTESVTNTKLHNLVDLGSVTNIVNADINGSAAIAYSKLNLLDSITDADIYSLAAISYTKLSLVGSGVLPSGAITLWSTASAPSGGWLICDGSAIDRTTYATLFAVISTTYGVGDGSTTFNIPSLKGKVPIGLNSSDTDFDAMGETGGSKTSAHTHTFSATTGTPSGTTNVDGSSSPVGSGTHTHTVSGTSGSTSPSIVQPYIVLNYIIKT